MTPDTQQSADALQSAAVSGLADRLTTHATPVRLRLVALTLAVSAHAALLYALASPSADTLAGGGGQQLDAISVTVVSAAALESLAPDIVQPPAPAAASAAVEANEGARETPATPEQHEQKEETAKQKSPPQPVETAAIVPMPREEQKQDRKEASAPAPAGGVTSRGDAAPNATNRQAPAAASAGALREYARYVAQALAKAKPKGVGTIGTVKVKLVIAPLGGLASVEIVGSSGNKQLDAMAVAAVQHAALPAPPPGLTPTELTYEVPYHFR